MKEILFLLVFTFLSHANAQVIADFENISIPTNTFIKDAETVGGFESGAIILPNSYEDAGTFDFWNGWVLSNVKDTVTAGFSNEGASFAGSGYQSENYAVAYAPEAAIINLKDNSGNTRINGMYVCNSTYAALSMRNGDSFAKRFGGETGDDPDYFFLSIKKYSEGNLSSDSIVFYLADYRFNDNELDYIIKDWTWLDLSSLGVADSLYIELFSSDVGAFGINTPTYFCIDDLSVDFPSITLESINNRHFNLFPNPTDQIIHIPSKKGCRYRILNSNSLLIETGILKENYIDVSNLESGIYIIQMIEGNMTQVAKFVKK